jgi:hypothetical protein
MALLAEELENLRTTLENKGKKGKPAKGNKPLFL